MNASTKLQYPGIDKTLTAYAINLALDIDTRLNLHGLDFEDNVQTLIIQGLSLTQTYRQGLSSLSTFLLKNLQHKKKDILKSYSSRHRRALHPQYRKDAEISGNVLTKDMIAAITENQYVAESAGIQLILSLLTPVEQKFVLALQDESIENAGLRVGWKRSTTFNRLAEIRKKLKKVWTDFGKTNE